MFTSPLTFSKLLLSLTAACGCLCSFVFGQNTQLDSLRRQIAEMEGNQNFERNRNYLATVNSFAAGFVDYNVDSTLSLIDKQIDRCEAAGFKKGLVDAWKIKGNAYTNIGKNQDALACYQRALQIAERIKYPEVLTGLHNNLGMAYNGMGNNAEALREYYTALELSDKDGNEFASGVILNNIGIILFSQKKYSESANHFQRMKLISRRIADTIGIVLAYSNLAEIKSEQQQFKEALLLLDTAYGLAISLNVPETIITTTRMMGLVHEKAGNNENAKKFYRQALDVSEASNIKRFYGHALLGLAKVERNIGELDISLDHALQAMQYASNQGEATLLRDVNDLLSTLYQDKGDADKALLHFRQFKLYADSVNGLDAARAAATYEAQYAFSKKELEFQRQHLWQQWIIYSSVAAFLVLAVILLIINNNKRKLKLAYHALADKHKENELQRIQLQDTLNELRRTQRQLIQSEKMASLGELTAGIAHEIRNPLNFVTNFSELSKELLAELQEAYRQSPQDKGLIEELENDLQENIEKIRHHGKRADGIVTAMLQHSRSTSGAVEPGNLNSLIAEYLEVALHEIKARKPGIYISVETNYEANLPPVSMVQQEVGRVIFNLLNNALYASTERAATASDDFVPRLSVTTEKKNDKAVVTISDNGKGVPQDIRDRIFQPFFTTKPTGEGTGLGLSLSYDIVKAHGGTLALKDSTDEGATFELLLKL